MVSQVGRRAPIHCTALGKVLLAYLLEEERKKILDKKGLPRFTEKTVTSKRKLEKELCKVKEEGFALDRGEHEKDVRCIASPIRDHDGKVIATISISAPAFRIDLDKQENLKRVLIEASKGISKRLGWRKAIEKKS